MKQRLIDANAYAAELWKLRENYQMLDDTQTADKIMHGIFRAEQALKEQPTIDAISMREWNSLRNSIKELQENNTEKKDVQFVTKFLLRLMDISERREFNAEAFG